MPKESRPRSAAFSTGSDAPALPAPDAAPADALDALAPLIEGPAPGAAPGDAGAQEAGEASADPAAEARELVQLVAGLWGSAIPAVRAVWTAEACDRAAGALAPVFEKYGVSLGRLGPELLAALTLGPLVWQSWQLTRAHYAGLAAAARERAPAGAPAAPGAAPGPRPFVAASSATPAAAGAE